MRRIGIIALCVSFLVLGLHLPPANAATPVKILLLGDSYMAGNGARNDAGKRSYYGPINCYRSYDNWAQRWARTIGAQASNAACSGAVSDNIMNQQSNTILEFSADWAIYPGGIESPTFANADVDSESQFACRTRRSVSGERFSKVLTLTQLGWKAVCYRTMPAQIDSVSGDEDVIFVSLGGNNLGFGEVVDACFSPTQWPLGHADPQRGKCLSKVQNAFSVVPTAFGTSTERGAVEQTLVTIAEKAPRARLVYTGYPGLEYNPSFTAGGSPIGRMLADGAVQVENAQRAMVERLNAMASVNGRVTFVPIHDKFLGHEPDGRADADNLNRWLAEIPGYKWLAGVPTLMGDLEPGVTPGDGGVATDYRAGSTRCIRM